MCLNRRTGRFFRQGRQWDDRQPVFPGNEEFVHYFCGSFLLFYCGHYFHEDVRCVYFYLRVVGALHGGLYWGTAGHGSGGAGEGQPVHGLGVHSVRLLLLHSHQPRHFR